MGTGLKSRQETRGRGGGRGGERGDVNRELGPPQEGEGDSGSSAAYTRLRTKTAYEFMIPSLEPGTILAFTLVRVLVGHLVGIVVIHSVRFAWGLGLDMAAEDIARGEISVGWQGYIQPVFITGGLLFVLAVLAGWYMSWIVEVLSGSGKTSWTVRFWIVMGNLVILVGLALSLLHLR